MSETAEPTSETAAPAPSVRRPGRAIPLPKREILRAFLEEAGPAEVDRARLEELARRLALLFHLDFFPERERLKELYVRFDPHRPGEGPIPAAPEARAALLDALDATLMAGNFRRMDLAELGSGTDSAGRVSARVRVPREAFDALRFYGRGLRPRPIEVSRLFGLKRETVEAPVWTHVVLVAAVRPDPSERRRGQRRLRPGAVHLKLFRDIPQADLETLLPNARVVMRLADKLILGVPAVVGGVPILANILPALSVLLVVLGAWLGISGTVEEDAMKQALAALSGLGALGGFLMRQWIKYERQKLKYQNQVAENAYFNTLNNNAGLFDMLVGQSEDAEVKEAFLAYAFLWRAGEPLSREALDAEIEKWLRPLVGTEVDFEIDDALAKLRRFGLVAGRGDGRIEAVGLDGALEATERAWAELSRAAIA